MSTLKPSATRRLHAFIALLVMVGTIGTYSPASAQPVPPTAFYFGVNPFPNIEWSQGSSAGVLDVWRSNATQTISGRGSAESPFLPYQGNNTTLRLTMPNSFLKGTPLAHVLNFQFKIGTYSPGDKFEVYLNGLYQGDLINFNQTTWNPITLDVPIYSGNGNTIIDWKITRGQAGSLPSPVMYLDAVQYFVTFPIQGTNDLKIVDVGTQLQISWPTNSYPTYPLGYYELWSCQSFGKSNWTKVNSPVYFGLTNGLANVFVPKVSVPGTPTVYRLSTQP